MILYVALVNDIFAQQPAMIVEIKGKVYEPVGAQYSAVENLPLFLEHFGDMATDPTGSFAAKIPYTSDKIIIEVKHPSYEILNPPEGSLYLQKHIPANSTVNIQIIVLGSESDETFKKQLKEVQSQVSRLKKQKAYSDRQLQDMNQKLLDTVYAFQVQRNQMVRQMEHLKMDMANRTEETEVLNDSIHVYQERIQHMLESNNKLMDELAAALQKRYLEQKEHFDQISGSLHTYVSRLKDVRDYLERIEYVFRNYQASAHFGESISRYGESYELINEKQANFETAISHFWESPETTSSFRKLILHILSDIHKTEILPLNNTVLKYMADQASGKRPKIGKAKKEAQKTVNILNGKIDLVENMLASFIQDLGDF